MLGYVMCNNSSDDDEVSTNGFHLDLIDDPNDSNLVMNVSIEVCAYCRLCVYIYM